MNYKLNLAFKDDPCSPVRPRFKRKCGGGKNSGGGGIRGPNSGPTAFTKRRFLSKSAIRNGGMDCDVAVQDLGWGEWEQTSLSYCGRMILGWAICGARHEGG